MFFFKIYPPPPTHTHTNNKSHGPPLKLSVFRPYSWHRVALIHLVSVIDYFFRAQIWRTNRQSNFCRVASSVWNLEFPCLASRQVGNNGPQRGRGSMYTLIPWKLHSSIVKSSSSIAEVSIVSLKLQNIPFSFVINEQVPQNPWEALGTGSSARSCGQCNGTGKM